MNNLPHYIEEDVFELGIPKLECDYIADLETSFLVHAILVEVNGVKENILCKIFRAPSIWQVIAS